MLTLCTGMLMGRAQKIDYTFDAEIPASWYNSASKHTGAIDVYPYMMFYNVWFDHDVCSGEYRGAVVLPYAERKTEKGIIEMSLTDLTSVAIHGVTPTGKGVNVVVYANGVPTLKRMNTADGAALEYAQTFDYPDATKVSITNDSGEEIALLRLTANADNGTEDGIVHTKLPDFTFNGKEVVFSRGDVRLYAATGKMVLSMADTTTCSLNGLGRGVYVLVWTDGEQKITKKILIK